MLTITQSQLPLNSGQLDIHCDYYYRNRISKIPSAKFNYQEKKWTIEKFALGALEKEFNGPENGQELVYKTPRWVILNQPMPDMSDMYTISDNSITVPNMLLEPYDYQKYGIKFSIDKILKYGFCLIADGVGLGKTCQGIGCFKWFIENKNCKKILIICKKSIKQQWCEEINKFTDLSNDFWIGYSGGTAKQRKKTYDEFFNSDKGILVVNHHAFLNDDKYFINQNIDFVLIDEVHEIKCRTGKINGHISNVIKGIPTLFLTGTPIMSRPEDIFGIIQIANPSYFGQWTTFKKRYIVETNGTYGWHTVGAKHLDELREKVQDILIRRTEYEVSVQLPEVRKQRINCTMDNTQMALLDSIKEQENQINAKLTEIKVKYQKADEVTKEKLKVQYQRLEDSGKAFIAASQIAVIDPRIFNLSNSKIFNDMYKSLVPKNYKGSSKMDAITDLVQDIISDNDKVILFSKYRTVVLQVAEDIAKRLKAKVLIYTGSENEETRFKAESLFKNTLDYDILIGTEAMSAGLNLQCARYVINIDQPDTFAIKVQRVGRVRRAGSTFDDVIVYDMITESTSDYRSKDEERLENIRKNQDLTNALVDIDESQRIALVNAMKEA